MFRLCAKDTGDFRPVACTFSTSEHIPPNRSVTFCRSSSEVFFPRWKTHKWRRCQLVPWTVRQDSPGAQETCGPGMQVRGMDTPLSPSFVLVTDGKVDSPQLFLSPSAVSCRKQDGSQADIEACLKFASAMPPLTQPCQLPCQEDCQLSNWSKFSPCTADCIGVRTRKRVLMGELGS